MPSTLATEEETMNYAASSSGREHQKPFRFNAIASLGGKRTSIPRRRSTCAPVAWRNGRGVKAAGPAPAKPCGRYRLRRERRSRCSRPLTARAVHRSPFSMANKENKKKKSITRTNLSRFLTFTRKSTFPSFGFFFSYFTCERSRGPACGRSQASGVSVKKAGSPGPASSVVVQLSSRSQSAPIALPGSP